MTALSLGGRPLEADAIRIRDRAHPAVAANYSNRSNPRKAVTDDQRDPGKSQSGG
jgi:hypothetical protein